MIPAPPPGVYTGVPADIYHSWDALNASKLKALREDSPEQVRYDELHPKDPTPDMQFGTLLHSALLEPATFHETYAIAPDVPKRGKANLELWADFEAKHAGAIRVKPDVIEKVETMAAAARRNPYVRMLLEGPGVNEVCVVWTHPVLGIPCKLRADRICQRGQTTFVLDVKSAKAISTARFGRAIEDQSYHMAAEWYLFGLQQEDLRRGRKPVDRTFLWLAQQKRAPFSFALHQPDPEDLDEGAAENSRLAALWAHCVKTDTWPGYTPSGPEICPRPRWARRKKDIDELAAEAALEADEDEEDLLG